MSVAIAAQLVGAFSLTLFAADKSTTEPKAIEVYGWTLPDISGAHPAFAAGDDPVFGRLACPPLTRLNLDKHQSEPLLIKRIAEDATNPSKRFIWRIEMRSDIFWWSGDTLKSQDLAHFLKEQLPAIVKNRAGNLWTIPEFDVAADDADSISINWSKKPIFGPYVLNGVPLWRAVDKSDRARSVKFECAGLYAAEPAPYGVDLKAAKGYKGTRPEVMLYPQAKEPNKKAAKPEVVANNTIEFQKANFFGGSPWARFSDEEALCKQRLELPFVTLLTWNTEAGPTVDKVFRRAMTELTPRGALLRSGAANLGELLSGPLPRLHPGYNTQLSLRPFSMEMASNDLNSLGFKRKKPDEPRLDLDGKPLKLVISTSVNSIGLVEKVLADAFTAVGITVEFVPIGADAKTDQVSKARIINGVLAGVSLEWPASDLLLNFHSGLKGNPEQSYPFWPATDKELDRELEGYSLSLTTAKPDFSRLSHVHAKLFDLEAVTVIMQHEACIEGGGNLAAKIKSIDARDPDWFRRLIL